MPTTWVCDHLEALQEPDVDASFGQVTGLSRWGADSADAAAMPSRHRHGAPPWLIGHSSNLAGLKSRLLSVGGFDERLGPGSPSGAAGEDADLIVRLLRSGAALVSGTGEAVRHIPWRTEEEDRRTIVSYEHGAGVWIGKALREEPLIALSFLRSRLGQRGRIGERLRKRDPGEVQSILPVLPQLFVLSRPAYPQTDVMSAHSQQRGQRRAPPACADNRNTHDVNYRSAKVPPASLSH